MNSRFKDYSFPHKQQGFTLIELLVASFILFLVIASITLVYRGAVLSSHKAERVLQFSSLVEPISEQIRSQIHNSSEQQSLQGEGDMGEITFNWTATVTHTETAPEQFNIDTGDLEKGKKPFYLWQVDLQLQLKKAIRQYQFNEVSW